eukprot:1499911-Amphidinium_carterae.1
MAYGDSSRTVEALLLSIESPNTIACRSERVRFDVLVLEGIKTYASKSIRPPMLRQLDLLMCFECGAE